MIITDIAADSKTVLYFMVHLSLTVIVWTIVGVAILKLNGSKIYVYKLVCDILIIFVPVHKIK